MTETTTISMPEQDDDNPLTETPTVLVCAGEGGIEMGAEVKALAAREGIANRVKMIAINTGAGKLSSLDADVATINLKTPDRRFHEHDMEARHYLGSGVTIGGARGSGRDRTIGRYHFDNPEFVTDKIESTLRTTISRFVAGFENDPDIDGIDAVNVFQFVGAGGGTGSGVTPLLSGCLYELLDDLDDEVTPGFEHWAMVSLATEARSDSNVNWQYVGNSLALLDELRAITGYDDVDYPIRIPVYSSSDGANDVPSAYEIDDNPFSGVFLLRYDQDRADEEYKRGTTRTAARTVIEWMRKGEGPFLDIENEVNDLDHTFYEVRGATFETPAEDIQQLLEANDELERARSTEQELVAEQADIRAAIEELDVVLDARQVVDGVELVSSGSRTVEEGQRPAASVIRTAFDRAEQIAGNISPASIRMEDVWDKCQDHRDRRGQSFHDLLDDETMEIAVFMAAMLDRAKAALDDHRFNTVVSEFVTTNENSIEEFDPAFDPAADPKAQFLQTIKPMLNKRIDSLAATVDSYSLTDRVTNRESYKQDTRQLEKTKETLRTMQAALGERDQLSELVDDIESAFENAMADLRSERDRLESRHEDVRSERLRAAQEREAAAERVDRILELIQEGPLGRFVTLPVADGSELAPELFESGGDGDSDSDDLPGIATLIDHGVIDRSDVIDRLRETLRNHEDTIIGPALETRGAERTHIRGGVRVFCTDELRELVWDQTPVGTAPADLAENEFPEGADVVRSEDPNRIGLLSVYGGLNLDNFDHGMLRESISRGRPEWNGEPVPLGDCYAYPEILPADHPRSMQSRVDQIDVESWGDLDD